MAGFVQDSAKHMPGDLMNAAINFVNKDNLVKPMVDKVIQSFGLPPIMDNGGGASLDANKIMGNVLGNNPQMKQAMDSNPEVQKQLQQATHK